MADMQSRQARLRGDPLPWLLDRGSPSVRYWTLADILDQHGDDPEVQEARAATAQQPLVQELFARQHPDGHTRAGCPVAGGREVLSCLRPQDRRPLPVLPIVRREAVAAAQPVPPRAPACPR